MARRWAPVAGAALLPPSRSLQLTLGRCTCHRGPSVGNRALTGAHGPGPGRGLGGVLVCGGNGALGKSIVQELFRSGATEVRVLDASPMSDMLQCFQRNPTANFTYFEGSILSDDHVSAAIEGVDAVVSTVTAPWLAPPKMFEEINVRGVQNVVQLAERSGVKDLVYVSSIAVTDHLQEQNNADEAAPLPPLEQYTCIYDKSKRITEDFILSRESIRTCAVRAGGILADTTSPSISGSLTMDPVEVIEGDGILDYIDAVDLARGVVLALQHIDRIQGEPIYITGHQRRPSEVAMYAASKLNRTVKKRPRALLKGIAYINKMYESLLGLCAPSFQRGMPLHYLIGVCLQNHTFSNEKARKVLGFVPQNSVETAIDRILEEHWNVQNNT